MVGEERTVEPSGAGGSGRRGAGPLRWVMIGVGVVAIVLLFRGGGSLVSGVSLGSTPLLAIGAGGPDQATVVEQGRRLYGQDCASCHGATGDRVAAAPLNSREFTDNLGPRLEQAISNGKGIMAAWGRERGGPLSSSDVKSVAEYVRSGKGFTDNRIAAPKTSTPVPPATATIEVRQAPPAVPHALANLDSRCLDCHSRTASSPMPVNHAGRASASCALCHVQGPITLTLPVTPPAGSTAVPAATASATAAPKR